MKPEFDVTFPLTLTGTESISEIHLFAEPWRSGRTMVVERHYQTLSRRLDQHYQTLREREERRQGIGWVQWHRARQGIE